MDTSAIKDTLEEFSTKKIIQKSRAYRAGGYKNAEFLSRRPSDYLNHLIAFMVDINVCLFPVYIWVIEFLLILCGIIPPRFFDLLFYIMFALLFLFSILLLGIYTAKNHGQSIGYVLTGLKLVKTNKKEAGALYLILRQALGIGAPLMVLGYFFQIFGIAAWWLINIICILVTPHQQSIFDLIFKLRTVYEPDLSDVKVQVSQPVQETNSTICPIDLHIRSNYSDDATYDVEEIFKRAKQANMEVISITDHNNARANAAAMRFASMYDIQYIPGVEVDAQYEGTRVRVLGYYIDWTNDIFDQIERDSLTREKEASIERAQKFEDFSGIQIDLESLMSNSRFQTITGRDITNMVFNNEVARSLPFVKKYIESSKTMREAKQKFLRATFGQGGPCFVETKYPEVTDIIKAIHDAEGMAILASWRMDYIDDDKIEAMMDLGFDGIECFSPDVHEETIKTLLKIVDKRKVYVTAGSDFHGPHKPHNYLGVTHCPEKATSLVRIFTTTINK